MLSRGGLRRLQPRQRSKTMESLRPKTTSLELKSWRWTGRKKRERRTKVSISYYRVHVTGEQWLNQSIKQNPVSNYAPRSISASYFFHPAQQMAGRAPASVTMVKTGSGWTFTTRLTKTQEKW